MLTSLDLHRFLVQKRPTLVAARAAGVILVVVRSEATSKPANTRSIPTQRSVLSVLTAVATNIKHFVIFSLFPLADRLLMLMLLLLMMMMMMMSVLMIMILMMMIVSVDGVLPVYMHLAGKFGSLGKATTSTAAAGAAAATPAGTVRGAGSPVEAGPTFQLMVIREVMWVTGTSMGAVGAAISDAAGGWHLLQSAGWKRRRSRGQGVTAAA